MSPVVYDWIVLVVCCIGFAVATMAVLAAGLMAMDRCAEAMVWLRKRGKSSCEPVPDKQEQAIADAIELVGDQAEAKTKMWLAFQSELNQLRRERSDQ